MHRVALFLALCLTGLSTSVAAQGWSVTVDPDDAPLAAYPNTSGLTATFQVYTTSLWDETVPLSCSRTGQVSSCSVASSVVVPGNGEVLEVQVTYGTGAAGSGTLVLHATADGGWDDDGSYNVTVSPPPPTITVVTPGNTVYTRTPIVLVQYSNAYGGVDTSSLVVTWGGTSVKTLGRYNDRLFEWEVDGASHELSPSGMKQLYVYVCSVGGPCSSATRNVTLAASPRPILSLKPMPLEAHGRQFAAPFGPGIGVSGGGDIEMGFSTPAYFSFNSPRTAGLTYSSRQSLPRALVNVDLEFPGSAPSALTMRLKDGGATVDSAVFTSPSCSSGGAAKCRVALQAEFYGSSYPAVRKWLRVEAQATISGTPYTVFDSVEVVLVDRRTTPYGSGWWPSGVMRLVSSGDDAILVASDGNASIFRGAGSGAAYISPPGQTSTLVKVGSAWELRFRGGGKVPFDSYGRQTAIVDINGNTDSITYLSTDQVYRIKDPKGKYYTFTYGNPNSTVSVITDPGGRQTTVTVNASRQLTAYVIAPGTRNYGGSFTWYSYTGSAVLPATRANVLGVRDSIHYTGQLRPYRVKLRTVQDENGNNIQPTIQYYPQELKALHLLKSFSDLYTEVIDPRNNWTRARLTRWGAADSTWDAVGKLGRSTYDAAGRVLTTEGKVSDSTKVQYAYDARGRLVRTWKVLNGGGVYRLDSLVYDAADRVIERLDHENRKAKTVYDGVGNVIKTITPRNDTTHYWYGAYGQLDSTRGPTTTGAIKFTYDAGWRNTELVERPSTNELLARKYYDPNYGRLTESRNKVTVQVSSGSSQVQWRRQLMFYNAANQADSARTERTNNCSAPCNNPSGWPGATDTLRYVTARTVFNRLGQDSTRQVGSGSVETFLYDALGRLVEHRPYSVHVGNTKYRYDAAGNICYTVTRRGDTLQTQYDSRNRVSQRILGATVGTFSYSYAGPNDELTGITASTYADPVGGSTVRAAWVYDSSGVLVRDTTQGNRVTAYAYSPTLLRLTSMTDAIGTRNIRYDATTGTPDSVSDPTDSWVRYSFDSKGRLHGPYLTASSGYSFSRTQLYRATGGGLSDLTNAQHYTVGELLTAGSDTPDTLVQWWTETRGNGATPIIMQDSARYDGWERVTALAHLTDGQLTASEAFSYDPRGNLTIDGNGATFNTKDQLTSTSACSSWVYDVAGNLTRKTCNGKDWVYTYDALDRLTTVTFHGGFVAAYTYDVLGNRIAKRTVTDTTRFVWRSGHVIYETSAGGTIRYSYQWGFGTDDLLAIHDYGASAHYYVVQDKLRSVRGLVNRNGSWKAGWRYRGYGVVLDSAVSGSVAGLHRFGWAGAQYDAETGFYFLRTRYYDSGVGRFVQEDKIGRAGGPNLYAYAGGRPLAARDPMGTMDDYYLLGELTKMFYHPNCWGSICDPDGIDGRAGGGGDWDGNGLDDAMESFNKYWDAGMTDVTGYEYQQWLDANQPKREQVELDLVEQSALYLMCNQNGLDCSKVQIVIGPATNVISLFAFVFQDAITLGNTIYVEGWDKVSPDLLVHEMTHAWQYQMWGWQEYYARGILERGYAYTIDGTYFGAYGMEQQGRIVQDCYRTGGMACTVSPFQF